MLLLFEIVEIVWNCEIVWNYLKLLVKLLLCCEIIGETGRDSTNGPYVIFDEHYFGEILDVDEVRNKAKNIDISKHPTRIQAVLKSIADGKKYYLRDATISLK